MKIKLYRSATVGVENKNLNELNSYDAIYISHIHLDHCSEDTLGKIDRNVYASMSYFHI